MPGTGMRIGGDGIGEGLTEDMLRYLDDGLIVRDYYIRYGGRIESVVRGCV